jgi:hypothetical protein
MVSIEKNRSKSHDWITKALKENLWSDKKQLTIAAKKRSREFNNWESGSEKQKP